MSQSYFYQLSLAGCAQKDGPTPLFLPFKHTRCVFSFHLYCTFIHGSGEGASFKNLTCVGKHNSPRNERWYTGAEGIDDQLKFHPQRRCGGAAVQRCFESVEVFCVDRTRTVYDS
jgi:hypothetical protein